MIPPINSLNKEKKDEGVFISWLKKRKFRKQFTNDEWNELEELRKEAFMQKMREMSIKDGKDLAVKEMKSITNKINSVRKD